METVTNNSAAQRTASSPPSQPFTSSANNSCLVYPSEPTSAAPASATATTNATAPGAEPSLSYPPEHQADSGAGRNHAIRNSSNPDASSRHNVLLHSLQPLAAEEGGWTYDQYALPSLPVQQNNQAGQGGLLHWARAASPSHPSPPSLIANTPPQDDASTCPVNTAPPADTIPPDGQINSPIEASSAASRNSSKRTQRAKRRLPAVPRRDSRPRIPPPTLRASPRKRRADSSAPRSSTASSPSQTGTGSTSRSKQATTVSSSLSSGVAARTSLAGLSEQRRTRGVAARFIPHPEPTAPPSLCVSASSSSHCQPAPTHRDDSAAASTATSQHESTRPIRREASDAGGIAPISVIQPRPSVLSSAVTGSSSAAIPCNRQASLLPPNPALSSSIATHRSTTSAGSFVTSRANNCRQAHPSATSHVTLSPNQPSSFHTATAQPPSQPYSAQLPGPAHTGLHPSSLHPRPLAHPADIIPDHLFLSFTAGDFEGYFFFCP